MELIERMKVASDLRNMSAGEKVFGSIQVALLGIVIVFAVLFLLFVAIHLMEKLLDRKRAEEEVIQFQSIVGEEEKLKEESTDDTELVAVITAAIAASLHTSTHNITVKNIARVPDTTPAWGKVGRMQQVNRIQ